MISKENATEVHAASLRAIVELSTLLRTVQASCSTDDFEKIKKGVGLAIGTIQIDLLAPLYADYPELDDLK